MTRTIRYICLSATLCTIASVAQIASTQTTQNPDVAYVYVSNTLSGATNEVHAYAAAANGKLTPVIGSPFPADVTSMAVNDKYLFGSNTNGLYVDAYWIESNGALRYAASNDMVKYNSNACGSSGPIFFDHTGATLYDMEFRSDCANNTYESFTVEKPTGDLQNLGNSSPNDWLYLPASFIGNNVYAYSASCLGDMYWGIYGFKRSSSGLLSEVNITAAPPTPPTGYFYCPSQAVADPTNHVAISMQPVDQLNFSRDRAAQLAAYTADAAGNLTTTNTSASMPKILVGTVNDLNMAPSGKLLAVGGTAGLQVFHFNGSQPVTHYTGLLTTAGVDQMFWDKANHLYAISRSAGKLFVFTITPTSFKQAPGSPYTMSVPQDMIVQPLPVY
jgi:hypothetical protein